ncbi:MAG: NADH:flavin oxidoreductase/NADH oxidase family protein [Gammaproteobacteria bacterium]|nr:MAG: NADH:flavin oxidoreductase/NADH oxidase family protein [Gammaproteobacteria bacterium]
MTNILGTELRLACGAVLPNRIAKAAMTEGLADADDRATDRHATLYRRWSRGGAGLLITGNVMVDRRYLERPGNVVIDGNGGQAQLREWARAGTEAGNHLWMQISHPGRQATRTSTRQPMSPSDVQLKLAGMFARPRAMSQADIEDAVQRYARVAEVARDTGFTGVQVHGAHGYLISQFLSPVTNRRTDQWGGSLENRARFLLETVNAVRGRVGADFPVAVKLNSADFQKGGFTLEDCVRVAGWLGDAGIDLLEISGGTYEQPRLLDHQGQDDTYVEPQRESTRRREAYFLEYAGAIQDSARVPLMVTGGFRTRVAMEEAVSTGEAAVIGLGRPLCVEPELSRGLIDGAVQSAGSWEKELRLGPGRLFGPASPVYLIKFFNVQGEVAWFYRQIVKLSQGQDPDTGLSLRRALGQHLRSELRLSRGRTFRPA